VLVAVAACGESSTSDSGDPAVTAPGPDSPVTPSGPSATDTAPAPNTSAGEPSPAEGPSSAPQDPNPTPSNSQSDPASGSAGGGSAPTPSGGPEANGGSAPTAAPATGGSDLGSGGGSGASGGDAAGGPSTGGGSGEGGGSMGGAATAGAGTGAGGSGTAGECTRDLLRTTLDAYFEALAAGDPSSLPLADNVKFTENGEEMQIGSGGLWATAGTVVYSQSALDTENCMSASDAVVPDGNTDIPVALRLRLEGGQITEIETIAVRQGDYSVASNTNAMVMMGDVIGWEDPVAEGDRATRDELTSWMNKYYRLFPQGVCNVTSDCTRLENGGGSFSCSAGAGCSAQDPGPGDNALTPRLILADEVTGIGVGFTMFQSYTDMHMFKMYGGQVYAVHAILASASGSGWD
jgi:hypothetical protein